MWTIGHSVRPIEAFLDLLGEAGITDLVDVRRHPASRRHPHFSRDPLQDALRSRGLRYHHEVDLGGHRTPAPDSPNTAWRVAAFRGYADHMASAAFRSALLRVSSLSAEGRPAVMCAEADPARCHRQLLADALALRCHEVVHLLGAGAAPRHVVHPLAREVAGQLVYPAPRRPLLDD